MSQVEERHTVWFENRTRRGIILKISGDLAEILGSDGQRYNCTLSSAEPLALDVCFVCGNEEKMTPADIAEAEVRTKRDWGVVPPPERRIALCEKCAEAMYKVDRSTKECLCAASRGQSVRCICEWRRSHEGPRK